MAKKRFSSSRKVLFSLIAAFFFLLVLIGTGETVMRLNQQKIPAPYDNKEKDALLGWKTKPYYHYRTDKFSDNNGGSYPVELNFTKHGFRKWDESAYDSTLGTVFFIGDSYVESIECSDDEVFYSVFKDSVPVRIYACGTAGYGTVQELLLLRRFIDTVKPNWVIVETCSNDYVDNCREMEMYSGYKVSQTRPYITQDGRIEYRYPRPWYEHVKDYSLFLNFIFERARSGLINLKLLRPHRTTEEMVTAMGKEYPPYNTTCRLTEKAFVEMKKECGIKGAKLAVFILGNLSQPKNEMDDIVAICAKNNIPVITGAIEKVESLKSQGWVLCSWDNYHFNPTGQKVLSQVLIDYFRKRELNAPAMR